MALNNEQAPLEGRFSVHPISRDKAESVEPVEEETGKDWLRLAKDAYSIGNDYLDASLRRQQEKNLDAFNNKHWRGSKYFSSAFKFRSKLFRPKTRAAIRRNEAAAAIAFFSTSDNISISVPDDNNEALVRGAELIARLVNYRLSNDIPWFITLVGAFQDTLKTGVCISKQTWKFEESDEGMDGRRITQDKPEIRLCSPRERG